MACERHIRILQNKEGIVSSLHNTHHYLKLRLGTVSATVVVPDVTATLQMCCVPPKARKEYLETTDQIGDQHSISHLHTKLCMREAN